jgi:hypothetical protein
MKINYISFIVSFCLLFVFVGCVKEDKEISNNEMFQVKIDSKELKDAVFIADNYTRYTFQLETLPGVEIDNDKQVNVSVSDGTIAPLSDPAATATQKSLTIVGGKVGFYYQAGRKAQPSALLSLSIGGINQTFHFIIKASEPDRLEIGISPANPRISDNIEVTAYLIKNNTNNYIIASEGLKIDFSVLKVNSSDPIDPFPPTPSFSNSIYDAQNNYVTAKKIITTNGQQGKLNVTVQYNGTGQPITTTRLVEFR